MDDFWYDITDGGYIKPEKLLDSKEDIKKVNEAVKLLQEFEELLNSQLDKQEEEY